VEKWPILRSGAIYSRSHWGRVDCSLGGIYLSIAPRKPAFPEATPHRTPSSVRFRISERPQRLKNELGGGAAALRQSAQRGGSAGEKKRHPGSGGPERARRTQGQGATAGPKRYKLRHGRGRRYPPRAAAAGSEGVKAVSRRRQRRHRRRPRLWAIGGRQFDMAVTFQNPTQTRNFPHASTRSKLRRGNLFCRQGSDEL